MTKTFLRVLILLILVAPPTLSAKAQDPQSNQSQPAGPAKQTATDKKAATPSVTWQNLDEPMILFDLQVVRRDSGELVTGLSSFDFKVVEDGFTRPVKQLSYGRFPLSVVLLVDVTKSFEPALAKLKRGIANALEKLSEKDEVTLIAFGDRPQVMEEFTRDRKTIVEKFESLDDPALRKKVGDKQKLERGLMVAGAKLDQVHPLRRRMIVLLTTESSFSLLPKFSPYSQAGSREVNNSGSTISGVILVKRPGIFSSMLVGAASFGTIYGIPPYPYPASAHQTPAVVKAWALRTGGEVFATERDGLTSGLIALFERMRERVTVGFTPLNKTMDGSFRRLHVVATSALERREGEVMLRFPEGYFAKPGILTASSPATPGSNNQKDLQKSPGTN